MNVAVEQVMDWENKSDEGETPLLDPIDEDDDASVVYEVGSPELWPAAKSSRVLLRISPMPYTIKTTNISKLDILELFQLHKR